MKKTILTLAALLMVGVAVNAQTDAAVNPTDPATTSTVEQQPIDQNRVRVQANDVPASLRQTLSGPEYKGWENTPVYLDKTTNQYSFSMSNNGASKNYAFDQNGQPIKVGASTSSSTTTQTTSEKGVMDNTGTYSSKKTSTTSSSTTGKKSSTNVHKSSSVKTSPADNSSSTSTTDSSSSTTSSTPVQK